MNKSNKKAIGGLIFSTGLIFLLIGAMTDVYTITNGVIISLAIWIVGGAFIAFLSGEKQEQPQPPEQKEQPEQLEQPQPPEQPQSPEQQTEV